MTAVIKSFFWSEESLKPSLLHIFETPSMNFIFGTDSLGRDYFQRLILGARVSLLVGIMGAFFSTLLGLILGAWAGLGGRWTDKILSGLSHVFMTIPSFAFLAVLNIFFLNIFSSFSFTLKTLLSLILSLTMTHWMSVSKVVRSHFIQQMNSPVIESAKVLGGSPWHIFRQHFWPSLRPTLFIVFTLQVPTSLMSESFISFVGLGVQSPMTSWGVLISEGWRGLSTYPHLILAPSAVIFLTVFSIHTLFKSEE